MMRTTLYDITKDAMLKYPDYEAAIRRGDWLKAYPAQVVLVVDQIFWARNCLAASAPSSRARTRGRWKTSSPTPSGRSISWSRW